MILLNEEPEYLERFLSIYPNKAGMIRKRIADGLLGFVFLDDTGEMIAYDWASTGDYYEPYDGFFMKLEDGQAYEFDGGMIEVGKLGKNALGGHLAMWSMLYEMGIRETMSVVRLGNLPAIKLHAMLGYRETGRAFVCHWFLGGRFKICRHETYPGAYLEDYIGKTERGRNAFAAD